MKFADLHLHSNFSDGTFSPKKIVDEAQKAGLGCISLTDHDTVDGIDDAVAAAGDALEVLPGIELTAEANGQELHILGYLIDHKNESFLKILEEIREVRVKRIYEICEKLQKLGVKMEPEEVFLLSGKGAVGRLHVARALVAGGHIYSTRDAFQRFIGDRGPAYVGKFKMTPKEAIGWILKVRGIPVLAHPYVLLDRGLIADFVKDGIMGIEAYYCEHSNSQTGEFVKIAEKFGLLITGGSDCHGAAKEEVQIGKIKLPYEHVEKLKEARCRLK
jgi:predicted metal-dependent phosphoesterase TrpH